MSKRYDDGLIFEWVEDPAHKSAIAREVLAGLPAWFGIPESTAAYVHGVADMPFLAAFASSQGVGVVEPALATGFMAIKDHGRHASEIYVTGVLSEWHRRGIGREMVGLACAWLSTQGKRYLTVKTLAASRPNAEYDRTRLFYQGMGFVELEVMPELWGMDNPCSFMAKNLREEPCIV